MKLGFYKIIATEVLSVQGNGKKKSWEKIIHSVLPQNGVLEVENSVAEINLMISPWL